MNIFRLIILLLILAFPIEISIASENPQIIFSGTKKTTSRKKITTTVKSKFIQVHRRSGEIHFTDRVAVEREDTSFLADKMIVYYNQRNKNDPEILKDKKDKSGQIKRIDAKDNVKIFQEEFLATGDIGSYDPKAGIFTIEKNVVFNNGTGIAKGEKFIYDVNTQKGYLAGRKKDAVENKNNQMNHDAVDGRVTVIINDDAKNFKENKE